MRRLQAQAPVALRLLGLLAPLFLLALAVVRNAAALRVYARVCVSSSPESSYTNHQTVCKRVLDRVTVEMGVRNKMLSATFCIWRGTCLVARPEKERRPEPQVGEDDDRDDPPFHRAPRRAADLVAPIRA